MPIRIPTQTIIVRRDGKNVVPSIGKPFPFTNEEVEELNRVNPRAIRKPINELPEVATSADEALEIAKAKAQGSVEVGGDQGGEVGDDQGGDQGGDQGDEAAGKSAPKRGGKKAAAKSAEGDEEL